MTHQKKVHITLGEKIKTLRERACMTQQELGEMLGVPASAVGQLESATGKDDVPSWSISELTRIFGVSYSCLAGDEPLTESAAGIPRKRQRPASASGDKLIIPRTVSYMHSTVGHFHVPEATYDRILAIAEDTGHSIHDIATRCINYALEHLEVADGNKIGL